MNDFDEEEAFRFKRQPPQTRFFTMEAAILNGAYDIVEHMQQLRKSGSREEITKMCNTLDRDIDYLRGHLRDVKAEVKSVRGSEPLSRETELQHHDEGE
jgi:hypothetical protein